MRRLLVILFVFATLSASSQTMWYKTSSYSSRLLPYGNWSAVKNVEIPIVINLDDNYIGIFSKVPQKISYENFIKEEKVSYTSYGSLAIDSDNSTMYITLYFYLNQDVFLKITYDDLEYKYKLK